MRLRAWASGGLAGTGALWCIAAACSPAAPPVKQPPVASAAPLPPAASPAIPSASAAVAEPQLPPILENPGFQGCAFSHKTDSSATLPLHLKPGSPVLTQVLAPEYKLVLSSEPSKGGFLQAINKFVEVQGYAEAAEVELHPAKAHPVGECIVPGGGASLRWEGGGAGKLKVRIENSDDVRFAGSAVVYEVDCDEVGLAKTYFDPMPSAAGTNPDWHEAKKLAAIPFSAKPGGKPELELNTSKVEQGPCGPALAVYERKGAYARVTWPSSIGALMGWVPLTALGKRITPAACGCGVGRLGGSHRSSVLMGPTRKVDCVEPMAVAVRVGGELTVVGRTKGPLKVRVKVSETAEGGWVQVNPGDVGLWGGEVVVPARAILRCTES